MKKLVRSHRFLKIIFGIGLFIILCLGGFGYRHIKNLQDTTNLVQHTYEVNMELEKVLSLLRDAKANQRGYIISKDSLFLNQSLAQKDKIVQNLAKLRALTADNPIQQKNLDSLSFDVINEINLLTETMDIAAANNIYSNTFKSVFMDSQSNEENIRDKIAEMIETERNLLDKRQSENDEVLSNTPFVLYSILILTLILLMVAYARINNDIKRLEITNSKLMIFKNSSEQAEIISKHGTWTWYIEEDVFEYSDNLYRLLGEEPQSFKPTLENFYSYVHKDDREHLAKQVDKMMVEKELPFVSYRIIDKKGNIRYLKAYGKLIETEDGNKQLVGTTADVTDDIKNYNLITQRNAELERNNKELSTFNYVASHDLQEPLRKIQTFISRLETKDSENFSEKGKFYIEKIKASSARMRLLIDDLLQYSRTSKSEKKFVETNMNMLLEQAKDELSDSIEANNATIKNDDFPKMDVIPFQMQQLFNNLINNSIKYRRKEIDPIIEISYNEVLSKDVELTKSSLFKYHHHLRFKDNGIGFDQSYADKIFILFKRLHSRDEFSGTGIGLSICKKIVENHNGVIVASGEPNVGAQFDIYLPFLK